MSFWRNPLKWVVQQLPRDNEDKAGWWIFTLPPECSWMERAARLHDIEFTESDKSNKKLSQVDAELFYRWVIEAQNEEDTLKRCRKFANICHFWPYARKAGRYFWRGS